MKKGIKILLIIVAVLVVLLAVTAVTMLLQVKKSDREFEKLVAEGPPHIEIGDIPDGIYKGSYVVFPVNVVVEVSISSGMIKGIDILKHINGRGGPAEAITGDIIKQQTLGVDTVSGATFSSLVILKAIEDALSEAGQ